jgi:hypothetical protein
VVVVIAVVAAGYLYVSSIQAHNNDADHRCLAGADHR